MASMWTLQFQSLSSPVSKCRLSSDVVDLGVLRNGQLKLTQLSIRRKFQLKAVSCSADSDENNRVRTEEITAVPSKEDPVAKFQGIISSLPPVAFVMKRPSGNSFVLGLCFATAFFVIVARMYVARKSRNSHPGSVADLVRRGQLRSDRRGISRPLKYDDPFNNPFVKISKTNSSVEMCGKVYRLAPVTLTREQQAVHQKRRSRAYQWKRPTIFLKEGDSIPPDVDPDTVRWIPANHPFATTVADIDEDLAQNNVYQKHGVPFRIQAEHEALQRKLETLQSEEKLNKLGIEPRNARDFERPVKLNPKPNEPIEKSSFTSQSGNSRPQKSDQASNALRSSATSEELQKP